MNRLRHQESCQYRNRIRPDDRLIAESQPDKLGDTKTAKRTRYGGRDLSGRSPNKVVEFTEKTRLVTDPQC
jgi:hypothetical protein